MKQVFYAVSPGSEFSLGLVLVFHKQCLQHDLIVFV